jgi:hypothetical protein
MQEPNNNPENSPPPVSQPKRSFWDDYVMPYFLECKHIAFEPFTFFETMPVSGGINEPMRFYATALLFSAIIRSLCEGIVSGIMFFMITGISLFVVVYLSNFVIQKLGGGDNFELTFRVFAYALSPATLLAWNPILYSLPLMYSWFLCYMGLQKVHKLSDVHSALVIVLVAIVTFVVVTLLAGTALIVGGTISIAEFILKFMFKR